MFAANELEKINKKLHKVKVKQPCLMSALFFLIMIAPVHVAAKLTQSKRDARITSTLKLFTHSLILVKQHIKTGLPDVTNPANRLTVK